MSDFTEKEKRFIAENFKPMENIVDSGERRQFSTGAQRDMAYKGRCDLLPWDVLPTFLPCDDTHAMWFCHHMSYAVHHDGLVEHIALALANFVDLAFDEYATTAFLETAFHFEAGAKKYSDRNWENGINVDVFLDSAGRHFLKYLRGDTDECHDRAVVWNLLCALWTIKHHPELIDVPFDGGAK